MGIILWDDADDPVLKQSNWWGPWFPKHGRRSWWDGWFPESKGSLVLASIPSLPAVDPSTPAGAATLALVLEDGAKVTYSWKSCVIKSQHGNEARDSKLSRPQERYSGKARVIGDDVRTLRALIARYAPLGSAFLLGLPYEGATFVASSSGLVVYVGSTAYLDWAVPGVRCACIGSDRTQRAEVVIQAVGASMITLDVAPGAAGTLGGAIMPAVPVYLDPKASFDRYQPSEPVESWQISAHAAGFGYLGSGVPAALSCAAPRTTGIACQSLTYVSRLKGLAQDAITVSQAAGGALGVVENVGAKTVAVTFVASVTTADQIVAAVNADSTLVALDGPILSAVLLATLDEFTATAMVGGIDAALSPVGLGSNVTYYQGSPLYDRGLVTAGTSNDSIQTLTQVVDFGALPFVTADSDQADWGRHIAVKGMRGAEFQWFKYFLSLVRGQQVAFWLPTYRADLVVVSNTNTTITITSANFLSWFDSPFFRTQIAVIQTDGTLTPAQIQTVVDNGDGTFTLTIPFTAALSGVPIKALSWLELVRLESDDVEVTFEGATFAADLQARVVQS